MPAILHLTKIVQEKNKISQNTAAITKVAAVRLSKKVPALIMRTGINL